MGILVAVFQILRNRWVLAALAVAGTAYFVTYWPSQFTELAAFILMTVYFGLISSMRAGQLSIVVTLPLSVMTVWSIISYGIPQSPDWRITVLFVFGCLGLAFEILIVDICYLIEKWTNFELADWIVISVDQENVPTEVTIIRMLVFALSVSLPAMFTGLAVLG